MLDADHPEPIGLIVRHRPRHRCEPVDGDDVDIVAFEVVMDDAAAPVAGEVELARFSTGATWKFEDRGTPVVVRHRAR